MVGLSSRARKAAVSRSRAFIAKRGERQISSMRLSSPGQRSPQVTVRYIGGEVRGCPLNHAIRRRGKSTPARRSRCSDCQLRGLRSVKSKAPAPVRTRHWSIYRKSVVEGKGVSRSVDYGCWRISKKKKKKYI